MNDVKPTAASPAAQTCPECGATLPPGVLAGLCPACLLRQGAASEPGARSRPVAFEPPSLAEMARLFPHLEIVEFIGKGGMGAVYKARQPGLDRWVALKVLPCQAAGGADFAERFNREARALAKLNHPNIVAVHEFGQAEALHYLIMEYVDGTTLRQMERAGRLSPREALEIVPALCDALQYAHDEGVVHRDIKPENVLVDRRGRVKIADFGLARMLDLDTEEVRLTGEGQVMGTPHYMAPEQIEHPLEVDHRADIYALGVVFYEMLTGELPLGRFAPPSQKVRLDVRLDEVVLRALEKEPERRYQQVREVRTAVETIAHGPAAAESSPTAADPRTTSPSQPFPRWLLWAPFQSARVREIRSHMTDTERQEATKRGLLFGLWNAATFFVPFFVILGVPAPMGWVLGLGALLLGLSFYPMLLKMQREHLCATAWARQQGITPEQVREPMRNRWRLALVGVRDGRRVIRWPQVVLAADLLAVGVVAVVWALYYVPVGGYVVELGPLWTALLVSVTVVTVLPLAVQRALAQPLERLPRLDEPMSAAPRGGAAVALPVSVEIVQQVRQPAMGLVAVGVANWVLTPLIVIPVAVMGLRWEGLPRLSPVTIVAVLLSPFVLSGLVFVGSLRMMRLQSYGLAIAAAILAMIVTPGNLIGFPIGIWALVVLLRPEVRAAFDTGRPLPALGRPAPSGGGNGGRTALIILAVAMAVPPAVLVLVAVAGILAGILVPALSRSVERHEQAATEESRTQPAYIHSVRVEGDRAVINGQGTGDYSLVLQIGATGTPVTWAAGLGQGPLTAFDGTLTFTAVNGPRLQFAVTRRGGSVAHYIDLASVPGLPQGRVVFRTVTPFPEADGSYVVADLVPESGPALPVAVSVRPTREVVAGAATSPGFGPQFDYLIGPWNTDAKGTNQFHLADAQGLVFFDLETGQSYKPPFPLQLRPGQGPAFVDITPELQRWIRERDVDLLLHLGETTWDMMALDMQEDFAGQPDEWETVSAAKVVAEFAAKDAAGLVRDAVPASSFGHDYSGGIGAVTAFRTRRNTMGVCRFEGTRFSSQSGGRAGPTYSGVSLHYKLVQLPAPAPAAQEQSGSRP